MTSRPVLTRPCLHARTVPYVFVPICVTSMSLQSKLGGLIPSGEDYWKSSAARNALDFHRLAVLNDTVAGGVSLVSL